MFKVVNRNGSVFGNEPYTCEFVCDTASDVSTLPTSTTVGTGGKTEYDNQVCGSGSIATIAANNAESKKYILNNQDVWCPYRQNGSSGSGGTSIAVDDHLSTDSVNPVQNNVITGKFNELEGTIGDINTILESVVGGGT